MDPLSDPRGRVDKTSTGEPSNALAWAYAAERIDKDVLSRCVFLPKAIWDTLPPQADLGPSWGHHKLTRARLKLSWELAWEHVGPSWEHHGRTRGRLGLSWELSREYLGPSWRNCSVLRGFGMSNFHVAAQLGCLARRPKGCSKEKGCDSHGSSMPQRLSLKTQKPKNTQASSS